MLESLVKRLKSRDREVFRTAVEEARTLPPELLLELLDLAERTNPPHPDRPSPLKTRTVVLLICGVLLTGLGADGPHSLIHWLLVSAGILLLILGGSDFLWTAGRILLSPPESLASRVPTILLMEGIKDPRFLGHLLNQIAESSILFKEEETPLHLAPAIGIRQTSITPTPLFSEMRRQGLLRFTWTLNDMLANSAPEHLAALTQKQRKTLLLPLNIPTFDVELTLRILKALEQVGGREAHPVVERLARDDYYLFGTDEPPSSDSETVRLAARKCLPYIIRNQEETEKAALLLRPSASYIAPETLLRPAAPTAEDPASELLRSTDNNTGT